MLSFPRRVIKNIAEGLGYEIRPRQQYGSNPMRDMLRLLNLAGRTQGALIFDIGANVGTTVRDFHRTFSAPVIHAFEPSPKTFTTLKANTSGIPGLTVNNLGIGSANGTQVFHESYESTMSSFLQADRACFAEMAEDTPVRVETVDSYCDRSGIREIDVLKSDTQGYELEVLRGCKRLLSRRAIKLVYLEIIFSAMYKGLPRFDELLRYLIDSDFHLVTLYRTEVRDNRAGWTDALFASNSIGYENAPVEPRN